MLAVVRVNWARTLVLLMADNPARRTHRPSNSLSTSFQVSHDLRQPCTIALCVVFAKRRGIFRITGVYCNANELSLVPFVVLTSPFPPRRVCRRWGSEGKFFGRQRGALVRSSHLVRQEGASRRRRGHHWQRHGGCPRCQSAGAAQLDDQRQTELRKQ